MLEEVRIAEAKIREDMNVNEIKNRIKAKIREMSL